MSAILPFLNSLFPQRGIEFQFSHDHEMMCSSNTVRLESNHELGTAWLPALLPRDTAVLADSADASSGVVQADEHSLLLLAGQGHPCRLQRKRQRATVAAGLEQLGRGEEDCRPWALE